ncbi:IclR family transcriptional regulator [Leucobacter allii]|uniref:IclR family transcriptional regulator n=1 Tax=Leucobacter allii TaxID=2932247 RepID=UPI001FD3EBAB|nr:IclR family transcriptional regulator [Leucobacter allii]UOR01789.1 IclR family transcriptional regulator [Leucobacter allii]
MARRSDGESVLHKHLRVLDAFEPQRPELTLSEIVEITGIAPSSAHRLVSELQHEGLLERSPERRFRLGTRLWEYASRTPGALGLRELARPWLDAVHVRVRQHTQLAVLRGIEVLFIDRQSTRDAVVNATLIGGRIPLPLSSSGIVLLAHAGTELVDRVVAAGWPHMTDDSPRDGEELRRTLRLAHARGYAVCDGYIHEQSRGIAVPVMGRYGEPVAALGVVVARDDSSPLGIVELLKGASHGISQALASTEIGIQPLLTTSRASLEYFATLDEQGAERQSMHRERHVPGPRPEREPDPTG